MKIIKMCNIKTTFGGVITDPPPDDMIDLINNDNDFWVEDDNGDKLFYDKEKREYTKRKK